MRRLTQKERERIEASVAKAVKSNPLLSYEEIKVICPGAHNNLIGRVRRLLGIKKKSRKRLPRAVEKESRVRELTEEGHSFSQIVSITGWPPSTVANAMRRAGIEATQVMYTKDVLIMAVGQCESPRRLLHRLKKIAPELDWTLARPVKDRGGTRA